MHWLSEKETNRMCGGPLFSSFKILLLFFDSVFSRRCFYVKRWFCIKCWNMFWWRSCGNRWSLKWQIILRINKSWVQNFPRCGSKSNDQDTKIVSRFYPWKVAIPYFSDTNDRVEIFSWGRALNGYINGNHEKLVQTVQIKLYQWQRPVAIVRQWL